jgi:sec-independent protein translocase protein TatB
MEILLIVVLALIVFGPAKLPEIMGQVGKAINDFRRATSQLSDEFNRTIQAELQETRAAVEETKSVVSGAHLSVTSAISGTPAPVRTAAPVEAATAPSSTSAEPSTNGTQPAESNPPLANTAQWSWETAAPAEPKASADVSASEPAATVAPAVESTPLNALETAPPNVEIAEPKAPNPLPEPAPRRAKLPASSELLPPY